MRHLRSGWRWVAVLLCLLVALSGCTYAALQRLSPDERSEFHIYGKIMTGAQAQTYLAKPSAAERTAYLRQIGLVQRFAALDPLDRDAVQSGFPRVGMSAEALLFVWGEPEYTDGDGQRYAHWYYFGSSLALAEKGNDYSNFGNRVAVYLVDGRVVDWLDYPVSSPGLKRRIL